MTSPVFERIYAMVCRIPYGRVASYGLMSRLVFGHARGARTVGWALAALPEEEIDHVPWWRVINAQGRISNTRADHGAAEQRRRLEAEGVHFDEQGYVDWERFGWEPEPTLFLEEGTLKKADGERLDT